MRSLVSLAVRRRVAVSMVALAVVAFGLVGYRRLPLDLLPDISYPSLTIQTEFPDTAPAEVENLITRPIEETVGVLKGLRAIHSVSRPGVSEVNLEFDWGSRMEMLLLEVRERLDRVVLPLEAEEPIVLRFDPSLDPILRLALACPGTLADVRRIADRTVKQELETIPGVAAARVKGGIEEEIQIDADQERLAALGVPLADLLRVVGASNVNLPGGSLQDQESQYLIRTVNEFDSIEEIGSLIVRQDGNAAVRVRDVARVLRGAKEREEITRLNGAESVEIDLYKEGDANVVTTAREVRERLGQIRSDLPPGSEITILFDQSRFVERAVGEVRSAAILGGILAVLVLLAFLRDLRSTLVIAVSIPLSLIATFVAMYRMGLSMNIMSLGGLTLGVGMLVDNSIVVLESIHRRRTEGLAHSAAAVEGTVEVGGAVAASTLTTVTVFLPIVFVEGIAGQLFGDMAWTVTWSLLASLVVAITMIPMLIAAGGRERAGAYGGQTRDDGMSLGWFSRAYGGLLEGAIRRRRLTILVAVLLLGGSVAALPLLRTGLIPEIHEGEFYFEVKMPEGTPLSVTDRMVSRMETLAGREGAVSHYYATIGSRLAAGGMSVNTKGTHLGQLNMVLEDRGDEELETALASRLRAEYEGIPDLTAKLGRPSYFSLKTPIEVDLFGEDLERLAAYSLDLQEGMERIPGVVDLRSSLEEGSPEIRIAFDQAKLASLGLDLRTLSETLQDRIQGAVPTRFKDQDRQIDIRVRNRLEERATFDDVRNLVLPGPAGRPIRLLTVADVSVDRGPAEIHRIHQQRAALITANLEGRSLGSVAGEIQDLLRTLRPPPGITVELGGQHQEMARSFSSLRFALLLAIFLVYLVMAATFESLLHPFIVIFTIPLALVGVVLGLLLSGTAVTVIVLIGVVLLAGIVVNNAIVLIDKINQLRRAGMEKGEAVVRAAHVRLRPILMTTVTTVLGLLPMAVAGGEGAELRAPLAITVSFGLALSTLLTLVVIPAVYMAVPSRIRMEASGDGERSPGSLPTPEGTAP